MCLIIFSRGNKNYDAFCDFVNAASESIDCAGQELANLARKVAFRVLEVYDYGPAASDFVCKAAALLKACRLVYDYFMFCLCLLRENRRHCREQLCSENCIRINCYRFRFKDQ